MDQILEKYAPAPQFCPDLTGKALGFNSCMSAFFVLIGGATTGLILLVIELVSWKTGSNWAWLDWYNKESDMVLSLDSPVKIQDTPGVEVDEENLQSEEEELPPKTSQSTYDNK